MALSLFTGFEDPFLSDFNRTVTRAFEPLFSTLPRVGGGALARPGAGGALVGYHPMDIVEHNDRYSIVADAPGMTPDDINVELRDGNLVVTGEKSTTKETTDEKAGVRVHRNERTFTNFSRSFVLPEDTQVEGITARIDNGVLTVDVPKVPREQQRAEAKRIRVTGGGPAQQIEGGTTTGATGAAGAGGAASGRATTGATTGTGAA